MNTLLGQLTGSITGEMPSYQSVSGFGYGAYFFTGNRTPGTLIASLSGLEFQSDVYILIRGVAETTARKAANREGFGPELLPLTTFTSAANKQQIDSDLIAIRKNYIFRNNALITRFFSSHRSVPSVLIAAVPELKRSFGDNIILHLEVLDEDGEGQFLYAIAMWDGAVEQAEHNLEDFDDRWWLKQQPRQGLTFTYELI